MGRGGVRAGVLLFMLLVGCEQSGQTGSPSPAACGYDGPPECLCEQLIGELVHVAVASTTTTAEGVALLDLVVKGTYPTGYQPPTGLGKGDTVRARSSLEPPCRAFAAGDALSGVAPGDELLALYEPGEDFVAAQAGESTVGAAQAEAARTLGSLRWVVRWADPIELGEGATVEQHELARLGGRDACYAAFGTEPPVCRDTPGDR